MSTLQKDASTAQLTNTQKPLRRIIRKTDAHWVGDGFPVTTMFSYNTHGHDISPFLLLDYAGPAQFEPSDKPRGVEQHPHRGFETVTIVYDGAVDHRDNAGNSGTVGPGDVQWMTAGSGILHEEMHGREFTQNGGTLEMVQLWVNLPAKDKMTPPAYQEILKSAIPVADLPNGNGTIRVIAGEYNGMKGAARTFTPMNVFDIRLKTGGETTLSLPAGHTTMALVLRGAVRVNGAETLETRDLALFHMDGTDVTFSATDDAAILLLNGEPIDEPIAGYGPFVMNTKDELRQAMDDYRNGKF